MEYKPYDQLVLRLRGHIEQIYPELSVEDYSQQLLDAMEIDQHCAEPTSHENLWNQSTVGVITYGNSITSKNQHPLATLNHFLKKQFGDLISWVHVLPFFPFTSDDGFAVSDYNTVSPELGDWKDIVELSESFDVMADLVVNHCSASHQWFHNFIAGKDPGSEYFYTSDPLYDHSAVVRPRTSELLRQVETRNGARHVWCTFGHDQVDLNFSNPQVLIEIVKILKLYLSQGVRVFRLDAVAFIWKEIGTPCLNLNQTHEIVRLIRTLIEHVNPYAVIITETNIPNQENLSYFGNANEAHCIYNFSLPPLLVQALTSGNCRHLKNWLMSMPPAQNGTTYFNFVASHDGIGLRPVEGLLDDTELQTFIRTMENFGGKISWRALDGGVAKKPYEVNIALYDALKGTSEGPDHWQLQRFICAHAIMLALEGIPALYIHSLLGTTNDYRRLQEFGHNRAINRKQWPEDELAALLDDPESHHHKVAASLKALIELRKAQPAFHPNATQFTLHLGDEIFGFWRQSLDRKQSVFCLNNISNVEQEVLLSSINLIITDKWTDLVSGMTYGIKDKSITLMPYQTIWLANRSPR